MTEALITLPVLTYHTIGDSRSPVSVSPREFRSHIEALATGGWRTLSLDRLLQGHRAGAWPRRSCLLTFDDGYGSVLEHAAPVLSAHGFTAIAFVIADRVGGGNRWPGQVNGVPNEDLLDWNGLAALVRAGFGIGAHSRTHPRLDGLDPARLEDEVGGARETIERALGVPVESYAYPYGAIDPQAKDAARRHFKAAFGTRMQYVTPQSDSFDLERLDAFYFLRRSRMLAQLDGPLAAAYVRLRAAGRATRSMMFGQSR